MPPAPRPSTAATTNVIAPRLRGGAAPSTISAAESPNVVFALVGGRSATGPRAGASGTVVSPPRNAVSRSATARIPAGRSPGFLRKRSATSCASAGGTEGFSARASRGDSVRCATTRSPRFAWVERRVPGQHLEEHAAERVEVGAAVEVRGVAALLGRHVERRAHQRAAAGLVHLPGAKVARQLGDPEVDQLDRVGRLRLDEDVLGLEVAVDDPLGVRGLQRLGHPAPEARGGERGERAPPRQHRGQRLAPRGTPSRCRGAPWRRPRSRTPARSPGARWPTWRAPREKTARADPAARPAPAPAASPLPCASGGGARPGRPRPSRPIRAASRPGSCRWFRRWRAR